MDELSLVRRAGDAISHHTSICSLCSERVDAIAETVSCKYALIYAATDAGQFELQAVSSVFSGPEEFPVVAEHKMRTEPGSPPARFADVIINASKRAAQLTKQLLSLSRKDPVCLRILSLNEAIRTTCKLLGETLDRKIRLEFDLSEESTTIKVASYKSRSRSSNSRPR